MYHYFDNLVLFPLLEKKQWKNLNGKAFEKEFVNLALDYSQKQEQHCKHNGILLQ
jgi:hypothetical protein